MKRLCEGHDVKHAVVYHQDGKVGAWPANCGIWNWGDEILVGYNICEYVKKTGTHSIDFEKPMYKGFSRSLDGGESWTVEPSLPNWDDKPCIPVPDGGFDFTGDFVLRVGSAKVAMYPELQESSHYIVSQDRGKTWTGPYALPDFGFRHTSRTDYIVEGPKTMRIFFSKVADPGECENDRAFCALTEDGGQTWKFLGYMTSDPFRSVMPSTVKLSDGTLVTAMRRRYDATGKQDPWIETRRSTDGGRTWGDKVRAGETIWHNGNPPALAKLPDGRLVLAYGVRQEDEHSPSSINIRVSEDGGLTWGDEFIVRDDALSWDLGYPRLAVREDGKCVLVYYYHSSQFEEQHVVASIFEV